MIGSSCTGLVRTVRTTERLPAYHFAHLVHQVTPTLREQMHIQPTRYGDARVVEKGGAAEAHQGGFEVQWTPKWTPKPVRPHR